MLKFYTVNEYESIESRDEAVPTRTTRSCRSQRVSGSDCIDIGTLEIEAIYFSASVVPTYHNIWYGKPEDRNMKLHAVTTLNLIGVGRYMKKDTNFNIKTLQKRKHMMAFSGM
jgi:hypothetical protein